MAKTVPESKFTELAGLDRISFEVHAMKCLWREITKSDFGIDGEIEVTVPRDDGKGYRVTGGIIKVQAKSGMSYITQNNEAEFAVKSTKDDFQLYYEANFPTIFIIYHPGDDRLYWKEMRSYLRRTPKVWSSPYRITFNKSTDVFDSTCKSSLEAIANVSPPRVTRGNDVKERLISNLLYIRQVPQYVWSAPCSVNDRQELFKHISGHVPPCIILSKRLYTLSNLEDENCVLREHCDTSNILCEPAEVFWTQEDRMRQYVTLLNQLLGSHLYKQGVVYNRRYNRSFFPRENHRELEFKKEWFSIRTNRKATRTTAKYYEYGLDQFWRHKAARTSFVYIGDSWYLQIDPMYFFTIDGRNIPWDSKKVGPYTTRIKAREMNQHVLNDVLFWSNVLSGLGSQSNVAKIWLDKQPILVLETMPSIGLAEFAILYDPALYEEPEQPVQSSLFASLGQLDNSVDEVDEGVSNED